MCFRWNERMLISEACSLRMKKRRRVIGMFGARRARTCWVDEGSGSSIHILLTVSILGRVAVILLLWLLAAVNNRSWFTTLVSRNLCHHSRVKTDLFNQSHSIQRGRISTWPDNLTSLFTIFKSWRWSKLCSQPDKLSVPWRFIQVLATMYSPPRTTTGPHGSTWTWTWNPTKWWPISRRPEPQPSTRPTTLSLLSDLIVERLLCGMQPCSQI